MHIYTHMHAYIYICTHIYIFNIVDKYRVLDIYVKDQFHVCHPSWRDAPRLAHKTLRPTQTCLQG